jgi:hypothetical protein
MARGFKSSGSLFSRRGLMRAGFGVGTALLLPNLPGFIPFGRATPAHDHEPADDDKGSKNFEPGAPFVEPEVRQSRYRPQIQNQAQYRYRLRIKFRSSENDLTREGPAPLAGSFCASVKEARLLANVWSWH